MIHDLFDDDAPLPTPEQPESHLTRVQRRVIQANDEDPDDPSYLHTIMCQTSMPYRRTTERHWKHRNGVALLEIEAGRVFDHRADDFVDVGLPWGARPRVVLAHLNGEALRQGTRRIEVEHSLSAFGARVLGYRPNGREMRAMRDHLTSLAAATVRMAYRRRDGRAFQTQEKIVAGMELWDHGDERQRAFWPSEVVLSANYFDSLTRHAVPLNPRHIAALKHSAMALDIYAWLGQRLHRITQAEGQFIAWARLHEQFGHGYVKMSKFREVFRRALVQVTGVYQDARISEEIDTDGTPLGLRLERSKPPVLRRG